MSNKFSELKSKLVCHDVISRYIKLKRSGGLYSANCPFHDEKTPSFMVNKDYYKCYGCGESGDVINFVGKYNNISNYEAALLLNEEFNVGLDFSTNDSNNTYSKEDIGRIIEYFTFLTSLQSDYIFNSNKYINSNNNLLDSLNKCNISIALHDAKFEPIYSFNKKIIGVFHFDTFYFLPNNFQPLTHKVESNKFIITTSYDVFNSLRVKNSCNIVFYNKIDLNFCKYLLSLRNTSDIELSNNIDNFEQTVKLLFYYGVFNVKYKGSYILESLCTWYTNKNDNKYIDLLFDCIKCITQVEVSLLILNKLMYKFPLIKPHVVNYINNNSKLYNEVTKSVKLQGSEVNETVIQEKERYNQKEYDVLKLNELLLILSELIVNNKTTHTYVKSKLISLIERNGFTGYYKDRLSNFLSDNNLNLITSNNNTEKLDTNVDSILISIILLEYELNLKKIKKGFIPYTEKNIINYRLDTLVSKINEIKKDAR